MSEQVGTTTICSADVLTNAYVLMDDELQTVDGTNKWFQLYSETQTTLEITYTTGAAETSNYVEFYIEFGSGSVGGRPDLANTMTWVPETVEYLDDSANQIVLEGWTYRIDGAAAAAYSKRIQLPVCTKGIRIYAKEVGVAANYGNLTIKANTVSAGSGVYNRSLQTVTLEAGDIEIGKVKGLDAAGTNVWDINTADTARTTNTMVLAVQHIDAAGAVLTEATQTSIKTAVELIDDAVAVLGTATYTEASSKGLVIGVVRNDTLAALADTDNEIAPLQVNATGALYVETSGTGAGQYADEAAFTLGTSIGTAMFGQYTAAGDNVADGQTGVLGMSIDRHLLVETKGYDSGTDSQKVYEVAPLNTQYVAETGTLTTVLNATPQYLYYDLNGYKYINLQIAAVDAGGGDTHIITLEGTCQDDGTAPASCTYQAVTAALTGVASVAAISMWIIDTPVPFKYLRIKDTTAGGNNDGGITVYSKKMY